MGFIASMRADWVLSDWKPTGGRQVTSFFFTHSSNPCLRLVKSGSLRWEY